MKVQVTSAHHDKAMEVFQHNADNHIKLKPFINISQKKRKLQEIWQNKFNFSWMLSIVNFGAQCGWENGRNRGVHSSENHQFQVPYWLYFSSYRVHVEQSADARGLDLVFRSIQVDDEGEYSCEAVIDGQKEEQIFFLKVIGKSQIFKNCTIFHGACFCKYLAAVRMRDIFPFSRNLDTFEID